MTRFLKFLGAVVAVLALAAVPAHAQMNPYRILVIPGSGVQSLSTAITAVDTAPVMLVKYIGPTVQANTFAVTTSDYIFTVGGSADATINVQATTPCGAAVGTLDTNDTDCDTLGELVNEINASPNWLAIPLGCLASEGTDTGGVCAPADVVAGVALASGTPVYIKSTNLATAITFTPKNRLDIRDFMSGSRPTNPFDTMVQTLQYYLQNFVGSATAGSIYAVKDSWGGVGGKTWTQANRLVYGFTGSATGVDKAIDFSNAPLFGNQGERFLIRGTSGTTHTSPRVVAFGFSAVQ